MTVNEAMLVLAEEYARKYGYIEVSPKHEIDGLKDNFWGNQQLAFIAKYRDGKDLKIDGCKYILPMLDTEQEENETFPSRISIDMNWGEPRLSVYLPDKTFACLTYKDGVYNDGQAFRNGGPELLMELKSKIDEMIKL